MPSLDYISFRKLRFTQPPQFHMAVCLNPVFVISCVLVVHRDTIQSELCCTKHYANTQQEILFLPLWILLSGYTVLTCSSLELPSFHLLSLRVDHSSFTHIQIKSSLAHHGTMSYKNPKTI